MKRIKNILIISLAWLFSACGNDWLDTTSSTDVDSETALNELNDLEFMVNGIYSTIQSNYYYGARMQYYGDVTGDDMQAYSNTKRCADYYMFSYNASNAPTSFWRTCYEIIQNANIVLSKIDGMMYAGVDEKGLKKFNERKNDLKGQALTLRALALFDVNRLYGYPYTKDNGASLGGAIVKDVVGTDYKPKRSTVAACYTEILKDLTTAVSATEPLLLEDRTQGKINKWAAMTLLSRVYLYQGDNENALAIAEEAIKGAEDNGFSLWTNEEYTKVWADDFTSEVFYEVVNLTTDGPGNEAMGYLCSYYGYKDIILTSSFVSFLRKDKADVRSKMFEVISKRPYTTKYPGQKNESVADANIPIFRLSELYLNAAEAAVKLTNENDKAVKYLDAIVKRGNPAKSVEGTTITLERVLEERRKEFFGEGHRMFDVIRNGGTIERKNVKQSDISSTKHLDLQDYATKFDWTMHKVVLPIPKAELDANENMKGQQNPGY
ncbi:MAG: RagB/SusD family nutrient uptake outer membrane protein [Odoribacter sp.]